MSNAHLVANIKNDSYSVHFPSRPTLDKYIYNLTNHRSWLPCATIVGTVLICEYIQNLHLVHEEKGWMSYSALCLT